MHGASTFKDRALTCPRRCDETQFHMPQSVQVPFSCSYSLRVIVLHPQLLRIVDPSGAVLLGGQGMHSFEASEKFSLKVSAGHFTQFVPSPLLKIGHSTCQTQKQLQPRYQPGIQVQSRSGANFSGDTCTDVSRRS